MTTNKASIIKLIVLGIFIIITALQLFGVLGWDSDSLDTQREAIKDDIKTIQKEITSLEEELQKLTTEVQALPSEEEFIKQEQSLKTEISQKTQNLQMLQSKHKL